MASSYFLLVRMFIEAILEVPPISLGTGRLRSNPLRVRLTVVCIGPRQWLRF